MLENKKITEADRQKGVVSAPDKLTGNPQQNKKLFDNFPNSFADKYNEVIDTLVSAEGASNIGTTSGNTVQQEINRLNMDKADDTQVRSDLTELMDTKDNSMLTAANRYTDQTVVNIGAGDMTKAVYDSDNDGKVDLAEVADFADRATFSENGVHLLTHSRSGTVHTLTGVVPTSGLVTVRFKAVANFVENDSFRIGTAAAGYVTFTAKPTGEEIKLPDKAFIANDIVTAEVDIGEKKINFKIGGGGGAKLNIFTQTATPAINNGVWIKTNQAVTKTIVSELDNVNASGEWGYLPKGYTETTGGDMVGGATSEVVGRVHYWVGRSNGSNTPTQAFDADTNTWTTKPMIPTPRSQVAAGAVGKIIYATCGNKNNDAQTVTEAFDTATSTWSTKAPSPFARKSCSGAVVGTMMYVAGDVSTFSAYDTMTNIWTNKAGSNLGYLGICLCAVGSKLYFFGGWQGTGGTGKKAVKVYDIMTNIWTNKNDAPFVIYETASAVIGTIIYLLGGRIDDGNFTPAKAYDTVSGIFSNMPSLPSPILRGAASVVDSTIRIMGTGTNALLYSVYGTTFPQGTLLVQESFGTNKARIILNDKVEANIYVNKCMYHNGEKLTTIPSAVSTGNGWKNIN